MEGKGAWGEVWKKLGVSFQEYASSGITQDTISLEIICGNTCGMLSTREAH